MADLRRVQSLGALAPLEVEEQESREILDEVTAKLGGKGRGERADG